MGLERKLCAVVTYANSADAYFPWFLKHYGTEFGVDSIFVVTPNPAEFKGINLGGLISVKGFPYDDGARGIFISNFVSSLLAYYKNVFVADVDELIFVDPRANQTLKEFCESFTAPYITCRGFDVIEVPDDKPLDIKKSLFAQRKYGVLSASMCKSTLTKIPINWGVGFHFCSYHPRFGMPEKGLYLAHLKFACTKKRKEIMGVVSEKVDYSTPEIEKYSNESIQNQHPILQNKKFDKATTNIQPLFDRTEEFDQRFLTKITIDTRDQIYRGGHFSDSVISDLSCFV